VFDREIIKHIQEGIVRGGGMLCRSEHGQVDNHQSKEFLTHFIRAMMGMASGDAVALAIYSAADRCGMTKNEAHDLVNHVLRSRRSEFPPGFMP
jgi:hypothetical protein